MLASKREVFAPTDGVLYVGTDSTAREERGADYSDAALVSTLFPLAFRRMRISARDVELADATGSEITAKVEVRHAFALTADDDVSLDGKVYEITRVEDRGRTCWLWLSEIAVDGTCDLLQTAYEYDAVGIPHETETTPTTVYVRKLSGTLKRVSFAVDALGPLVKLRLRASDYQGEQQLRRNGITYTVMDAEGHGRWVDISARERGSDRG